MHRRGTRSSHPSNKRDTACHPLTLPGMESKEADRPHVTLQHHVDAVVGAIDAVKGDVVLVGHSAGGGLAHAATTPAEVEAAGRPRAPRYPFRTGRSSTTRWSPTSTTTCVRRCASARSRHPSVPPATRSGSPTSVATPYPFTVIACEFPSTMYAEWIDQREPGARELAKVHESSRSTCLVAAGRSSPSPRRSPG
ncbi:MAG: alpha/beta hydrolase [Nocardioidaceae bacterium]